MLIDDLDKIIREIFNYEEFEDPCKEGLQKLNMRFGIPFEKYYTPDFLKYYNGLMMRNSNKIERIFCMTFLDAALIYKVLYTYGSNTMIFSHHPLGYKNDNIGFRPVREEILEHMRISENSIFTLHHPLDISNTISTRYELAKVVNLDIMGEFYNFCGGYTGVYGRTKYKFFNEFLEEVKAKIKAPYIDVVKYHPRCNKIALVPGGGNDPVAMKEAVSLGCDTYLTGVISLNAEDKELQKQVKEFLELARVNNVNLIGVGHHNSEKFAIMKMAYFFNQNGLSTKFISNRNGDY